MIDAILVPQGTEYKAVCRGVKDSHSASTWREVPSLHSGVDKLRATQRLSPSIPIVSLPIGFHKVEGEKAASHLKALNIQRVVMMGLCGSLSKEYFIGDIVLYQSCFDPHQQVTLETDQKLTTTIHHHLATVSLVKSLTSDRVISSAQEKQQLYRTYKTDVIDMEGFGYLQLLQDHNIAVAMLRVISDDAKYDIPDLTQAIGDRGQLKTLPLTIAMVKQPLAAIRLIKGSLQGLQILETTVKQLFS